MSGQPAYGFPTERAPFSFDTPDPFDVARFIPAPGPSGSSSAGSPPPIVSMPPPPVAPSFEIPQAPASAPAPSDSTQTFQNPQTGTEAVPTYTGGVGDVPPPSDSGGIPGVNAAGDWGTWQQDASGNPVFVPQP